MATQRYISTSFWDDEWVMSLSIAEKATYLYLMTNTLTNIAGVYRISMKRIAYDLDVPIEEVKKILERFRVDGKAYHYSEHMIIPSWPKHQKWERRAKIHTGIENVLESLSPEIIGFMVSVGYAYDLKRFPGYTNHKVSIPYPYVTNYLELDPEKEIDSKTEIELENSLSGKPDEIIPFKEVFDYLNEKMGSSYKGVEAHKRLIRARFGEGNKLEDFKTVIDFKVSQWKDDEKMSAYIRPDTLFSASHFDSYLQEAKKTVVSEDSMGSDLRGQDKLKEILQWRKEAMSGHVGE